MFESSQVIAPFFYCLLFSFDHSINYFTPRADQDNCFTAKYNTKTITFYLLTQKQYLLYIITNFIVYAVIHVTSLNYTIFPFGLVQVSIITYRLIVPLTPYQYINENTHNIIYQLINTYARRVLFLPINKFRSKDQGIRDK